MSFIALILSFIALVLSFIAFAMSGINLFHILKDHKHDDKL